jgi:hypothetical protein
MKRIFTLLFATVLTTYGQSQTTFPNMGFESWNNVDVLDSLDEWTTSTYENQLNGIPVDNSYQVGSAYDGSYALHLETIIWYDEGAMEDDTLFGYAVKQNVDNDFVGFPYTDTVNVFSGWYKCDIQTGDSALVVVHLKNGGAIYSADTLWIKGVQSTWTQFTIPLTNGVGNEPDSVFVGFASSDPFTPNTALDGSWIEVDDVSFDYTVASMTTPSVIPNNSFEDMITTSTEELDDWFTFNPIIVAQIGGSSYATKSTDAAEGTYSVRIETTADNFDEDIPALVTNGYYDLMNDEFAGGDAFNAQPGQFTGQYKYTPSGTDSAWVLLYMWNAGNPSLIEIEDTLGTTASWTDFSIDLTFSAAPDSMQLILYSGDNVGSVLYVDDLQFAGGDLGTETIDLLSGWTYFPNPANSEVTVNYTKATSIEIIDISGKTMFIDNNPINSSTKIATDKWNNGIYFIRLNQNGLMKTKKLVIKH